MKSQLKSRRQWIPGGRSLEEAEFGQRLCPGVGLAVFFVYLAELFSLKLLVGYEFCLGQQDVVTKLVSIICLFEQPVKMLGVIGGMRIQHDKFRQPLDGTRLLGSIFRAYEDLQLAESSLQLV